jgi:hypothetical protein
MQARTQARKHTLSHTHTHTQTHTHTHARTHTHSHTHSLSHSQTLRAKTHRHTHARTQSSRLKDTQVCRVLVWDATFHGPCRAGPAAPAGLALHGTVVLPGYPTRAVPCRPGGTRRPRHRKPRSPPGHRSGPDAQACPHAIARTRSVRRAPTACISFRSRVRAQATAPQRSPHR